MNNDETLTEETDETNEELASNVRRQYHEMRDEITDNRLDFVDPNGNAIEMQLEKLETIFKSVRTLRILVKKPREGVSDSNILLELAILGKERIRNVHCVFRSFNPSEYIEKLKVFMVNCGSSGRSSRAANTSTIKAENGDDDEQAESDDDDDDDEDETVQSNRRRRSQKSKQVATTSQAAAALSPVYCLTGPALAAFGKVAMSYFRLPPRPTFLLGSLDNEVLVRVRKARQRRVVDRNVDEAVKTKVKELGAGEDKDENSTVNEVERIDFILRKLFKKTKGTPICFYTFIVHPTSFSRTIENIFYVAFLVKDGYAKISLDECNLPVIEPIDQGESGGYNAEQVSKNRKSNKSNVQSMVSLSISEWKEIVEVFAIERPLIPDPKANK